MASTDEVLEVTPEVEEVVSTATKEKMVEKNKGKGKGQQKGQGMGEKWARGKPHTSPRNVKSPRMVPQECSPNSTKRPLSTKEEARIVEPITWLLRYVRPRKPLVRTPKNLKCLHSYMQIPLILGEVPIIGEAYSKLSSIKFDDHDLANLEAFPELAPELYLERVLEDDVLKVVPMLWAHGLVGLGLLNLMPIPHFG